MRNFCVYTGAQFKRILRYAPFVFLVTLAIALCLGLALVTAVHTDRSDGQGKIGIGIVGDFESSYLGIGLGALQSFDSSRYFLELTELGEAEAREKLLRGELAGYLVIPEGFVDDAIGGKVGKLRFVAPDGDVEIINMLKEEVLSLISCVLVESQKGIYGMQDAFRAHGIPFAERTAQTDEMLADYMGLILNRSKALEVEVIGVGDSLTFGGYLFSGISVLLMLLSGIVFCPLLIYRDYSFPRLMRANRYGVWVQTAGEYLAFFAVMAVNTSVLLLVMSVGAARLAGIPELSGAGAGEILRILLGFIPAILSVTALQYLLYQLADSVVSGVLLQFVSAVFLGYVSGCFYPIGFFPVPIRRLSAFLPSGMARGYLSSLITGGGALWQVLGMLLYAAALLVLAGSVRARRIRKG